MEEVRNRTYSDDERVETDGVRFVECTFDKATLVYTGGEHPRFESCIFGDIGWRFTGSALRTIQLLQMINNQDASTRFIADIFKRGTVMGE